MARTIFVVATRPSAGLTSSCLGLVRAFDRAGEAVAFVKPIAQLRPGYVGPERSRALVELTTSLSPPTSIPLEEAEGHLAAAEEQLLLEKVVALVDEARAGVDGARDPTVIVEGLVVRDDVSYAERLNALMARALDAELILVGVPHEKGPSETAREFTVTATAYEGVQLGGCLLNRVQPHAPKPTPAVLESSASHEFHYLDEEDLPPELGMEVLRRELKAHKIKLLGAVPERRALAALRVRDIARMLKTRTIAEGDLDRRVIDITVAAKAVPSVLKGLVGGKLVIVPSDRHEVIMAAALSTLSGNPISALLLSGQSEPDARVLELCQRAVDTGMTILCSGENTLATATAVLSLDNEVPIDDQERAELVMNTVASFIDEDFLHQSSGDSRPRRLSPPAFRHLLILKAREKKKRIVLPEGEEPRTIAAAITCQRRGIANCLLLGDAQRIAYAAADQGLSLPDDLEIKSPAELRPRFIEPFFERRRAKGISMAQAEDALNNPVTLGTMMLAEGEVDGLVSGAIHTTADTIRPALQLIKTAPGSSLVSSIFFMCLPDQVLVYGDCAVNPEPSAEELAQIGIQSAESAKSFGIEPRVAFISYSTGSSGKGAEVEKVEAATKLARNLRPDLTFDGPLQYDAATIPEVARSKAPKSDVAGRATVLIFPDLNTGNTTYKAVQRSAHVVSMGPMLQGLNKPVNDLSRGCLVEDIVYTIALTAIQASGRESSTHG